VTADPLAGPLADAVEAARRGELIVFPTDTVYGIGTRPDDAAATARLFAAKRRERDLALPLLASTPDELAAVAVFDRRAERLARALWPGALTIVVPRSPASATWNLGGDGRTVGVRVPAHRLARALLGASGPLAVSSANRSGESPARTCAELVESFGADVDLYLCTDEPLVGTSSTVVDLAHGPPRLLREGDVTVHDVERFLPDGGPLLDSGPL
jgi:tRNA threonylcarbamoyl adenosine modification protein (Sua5/YciO/YrdC/YwlC family)